MNKLKFIGKELNEEQAKQQIKLVMEIYMTPEEVSKNLSSFIYDIIYSKPSQTAVCEVGTSWDAFKYSRLESMSFKNIINVTPEEGAKRVEEWLESQSNFIQVIDYFKDLGYTIKF